MRILYVITRFLFFPGAYLRGFWEHVTCRLLKLMVDPVGYLRPDEACSHVEHSLAQTQFAAYLISTGPGFMNFNMGIFFFLFGYLNIQTLGITPHDNLVLYIIYVVAMYVGISLLNCLFPLTEDILNFWDIAYGKSKRKASTIRPLDGIGKVLGFPGAVITRAGAFFEKNCVFAILWIAFIIWQFFIR